MVDFGSGLFDPDDLVAVWDVPLAGAIHRIEFEHGTTTGKRVIRIDGKDILHRDWMFKLVGKEQFDIGKAKGEISIDAMGSFAYEYSLVVNGKPYKKFAENQTKVLQTWTLTLSSVPTRICLEKDTLDVWVNGYKADTAVIFFHLQKGEFVENGTETHFEIGKHVCHIKAESSGNKKTGLVHSLYVDSKLIPPCNVMNS